MKAAEPIAVVGLGCRFPGAPDVHAYWRVIREGIDATGEIPASRWNVAEFFDPTGQSPGKMSTRWGGFLDDVDLFDAPFFGISPREAAKIDPQHRLLLEVVWEALEYGGFAPDRLRGSATGVFIGIGGVDYSRIPVQLEEYFEQISVHSGTGNALSIAANRISYVLDLRGPSMSIDTACSSSMVATHLAMRSLRSQESDLAIVGGVNLILTPETTIAFSQAQMLSPDGVCRPFDARANGYVRGEGCGILILKRLSDAVADRDNVLAIVRGSAVNQDGRTSGITAPRGPAQEAVIRKAWAESHVAPGDVTYIEAHGTGTPLGDPIEVQALVELFGKRASGEMPCYLTSVKANIGHTETASGVASLIKVILMMQHGCIPAQPHFETLNPHIGLENSRLKIARENTEWQAKNSRVAGVSSFGFGGTNAHVVLEEPRDSQPEPATSAAERPFHVLTIAAKSAEALQNLVEKYKGYLDQQRDFSLPDVCYTANTGRSHFTHRLAVTAETPQQLLQRLDSIIAKESTPGVRQGKCGVGLRPKIAFLFTGQGSQYVGMGRGLFETQPTFRDTLSHCEELLRDSLDEPLLSVLFDEETGRTRLDQTSYTQPALFALEYSLTKLWQSWGIEPDVVLGHSVGEYVAACVAGVFSLEDGLRLIAERGRLMQRLPSGGQMAAVFTDVDRVAEAIAPMARDVAIAAANGPQNTVISGRAERVQDLIRQFEADGVRTQQLAVSHAFHSPLMEPMLDEFEQAARGISYRVPRIPLASNLTGRLIVEEAPDAAYWRDHVRNTVRFAEGMKSLASRDLHAVLEVGPAATLLGMARRCCSDLKVAWLPSLRKGRDDWQVILDALADLYVGGARVDWAGFDKPWPRHRLPLPTYPFQRTRHWYDLSRRIDRRPPGDAHGEQIHPLLGRLVPTASPEMIFQATLNAQTPPYLAHHCVDSSPVMPAAAYLEQALAAADQVFGEGNHIVENVSIQQAMMLANGHSRTVQVVVSPESNGQCTFETYSRKSDSSSDDPWTLHACGTLRAKTGHREDKTQQTIDKAELLGRVENEIQRNEFYQGMANCGLDYGPSFQVLGELKQAGRAALATLDLPPEVKDERGEYHFHPALLDACFQSLAGVVPLDKGRENPGMYLPTHVRRIQVHARPAGQMWAYTERTSEDENASPDSVEANVYLVDEAGRILVELIGARAQRVTGTSRPRTHDWKNWLYEIQWQQQPLPEAVYSGSEEEASRSWLVFADKRGIADLLVDQLESRGQVCTVVRRGNKFRKVDADSGNPIYEIDPLSAGDYRQLMDAWQPASQAARGVIYLWGADPLSTTDILVRRPPDVDGIDPAISYQLCRSALQLFQQLARMPWARSTAVHLITRGAQAADNEESPVAVSQAALWGLGRTAALEMSDLSCRLVDLDPPASAARCASDLSQEVMSESPESQVRFRGKGRYVARLTPASLALPDDNAGTKPNLPQAGPFSLRRRTAVGFDSLRYVPVRRKPPGTGEVEIEVGCAGLNFSDVLKAIGLYPGIKDEVVPLGIECAGVVTAVGDGVHRFDVGQRVMGVAPYSFASHTTTAEYALVATPEQVTDEEACTVPITFLTAYYALRRLAQLQSGERILIHAAAGGVGLAAIQIAQQAGAEIFATAGSDEKREFLRSLGVQHVMDSRTLAFADEILQATDRKGVDVVLNSLPGEAINKSISILSGYGRFLEIGKIDIYQNRMIGLLPFQDNLSYFAIDLDRMLRQRPDFIRDLFSEVIQCFHEGAYRPLPLKSFPAGQIVDAFRYMAQRRNIGKVVVSFQDLALQRADQDRDDAQPIRSDGTYLVTGGLGALGMRVTEWLVAQGARYVALLSRRPPSQETALRLNQLRESGAKIALLQGDVTDAASLRSAIDEIAPTFPALRGVFHAAGVLADGMMFEMDQAQLEKAMAPKVAGAWNIHHATLDAPIELFVLFSSVASVLGSPGQANYAAGNAFLDGLAWYRRSAGLPAVSINWGPWADAGMAAEREAHQQLDQRGMNSLRPDDALKVLAAVVRDGTTNLAVMDVRWDDLLARMPSGPAPILERVLGQSHDPGKQTTNADIDEEFCHKLREATDAEQERMISAYIAEQVASVMGIDRESLDVDQSLGTLGLDSLMGMELKANLESRLGLDLPMASLFDNPTVKSLASISRGMFQSHSAAARADSAAAIDRAAATGEGSKPNAWSPLVELASGGDRAPLFCVHPVGGDLRCYRQVARCLQNDRPVWGLRPRGLESGTVAHVSLDKMISDYLQSIRNIQPEGPYYLAGWSTGGLFAYEIAVRLRLAEAPVGGLVLLDTPKPSIFRDVDLGDNARFLFDVVNFSNWFANARMRVEYEQLRQQTDEESIHTVLQEAKLHSVLAADASPNHLRRLVDVCKHHVRLILDYQPGPYDLPVHFIRPSDTTALAEASGQALDDDLGWGGLLQETVIHRVPGNHFSMMTGSHAREVAATIAECLSPPAMRPVTTALKDSRFRN